MKDHEAPNPMTVRPLGAQRIVVKPHDLPDLVEQSRLWIENQHRPILLSPECLSHIRYEPAVFPKPLTAKRKGKKIGQNQSAE
jgi:hypothetical protein